MAWTTVALIAVAVIALLTIVFLIAWAVIARAAMKNFERASARMDEEFRNFPRL